ncbi:MAG TPA: hypothetical protein VE544_00955 [Nitrososphaeraceae archaeon]|nr:hypothetical protein [Nitrososphaeraceae archaeon]
MIAAKAADIFRDDHIRSQNYFIIERKAHRRWRQWLPERYGKGVYFGLVNILVQVFFYYTKRESGDTR